MANVAYGGDVAAYKTYLQGQAEAKAEARRIQIITNPGGGAGGLGAAVAAAFKRMEALYIKLQDPNAHLITASRIPYTGAYEAANGVSVTNANRQSYANGTLWPDGAALASSLQAIDSKLSDVRLAIATASTRSNAKTAEAVDWSTVG